MSLGLRVWVEGHGHEVSREYAGDSYRVTRWIMRFMNLLTKPP